jgi:hypothetical protein
VLTIICANNTYAILKVNCSLRLGACVCSAPLLECIPVMLWHAVLWVQVAGSAASGATLRLVMCRTPMPDVSSLG